MWKQFRQTDANLKCFRCGGPHKVADCKEAPRSRPAAGAHVAEEAPFIFLAEGMREAFHGEVSTGQLLSTQDVVAQGKAILDGGATRTIGSVVALSKVCELNEKNRGTAGVKKVDMNDRPIFGFGNSSRNQCASTAQLEVPLDGRMSTLKVHALDEGSAPILLSIDSLRKLGAVIDFGSDRAVLRAVDPRKLIRLERTAAGHQVFPLTEDALARALTMEQPLPAFDQLE